MLLRCEPQSSPSPAAQQILKIHATKITKREGDGHEIGALLIRQPIHHIKSHVHI